MDYSTQKNPPSCTCALGRNVRGGNLGRFLHIYTQVLSRSSALDNKVGSCIGASHRISGKSCPGAMAALKHPLNPSPLALAVHLIYWGATMHITFCRIHIATEGQVRRSNGVHTSLHNAGSGLGWQGWSGALMSLRRRHLLGRAGYSSIREQACSVTGGGIAVS